VPPAKHREPIVPAKVKAAFEFKYATPGADLQAMAQHVGLSTYKLREYLKRPEVLRWLYHEKRAMLEAAAAGNPRALEEIRDKSDNAMARVAAAKAIESMLMTSTEETRGMAAKPSPGLVVVIEVAGQPDRIVAPPMPPMIDVTPEREALEPPA
jgi:hypothetical protein